MIYISIEPTRGTYAIIRISQSYGRRIFASGAQRGKMQGKNYILVTCERHLGRTFKNAQIKFLLPYRCEDWLWTCYHHRPGTETILPCYHGSEVSGPRPSGVRSASSLRASRELVIF